MSTCDRALTCGLHAWRARRPLGAIGRDRNVEGVVTDSSGGVLPGVSVLVRNRTPTSPAR